MALRIAQPAALDAPSDARPQIPRRRDLSRKLCELGVE
jgi:hypothetical protein